MKNKKEFSEISVKIKNVIAVIILVVWAILLILLAYFGIFVAPIQNDQQFPESREIEVVYNGQTDKYTSFGSDSGYSYLVDNETGIVYLIYRGTYGVGLTPRIHEDGRPYTTEEMGLKVEEK